MTIPKALLVAGIILAISLGLSLAVKNDLIAESTSKRVSGVMMGLLVVLYANLVPKTLTPLTKTRCSPQKVDRIQRFAGWTLVLAGLGYSLSWLFLPLDSARVVAIALLGTGVLMVGARVALARLAG